MRDHNRRLGTAAWWRGTQMYDYAFSTQKHLVIWRNDMSHYAIIQHQIKQPLQHLSLKTRL
jgi:hypothetical protein